VAQELDDLTPRRSAVVLLADAGTTRAAAMPHLTALVRHASAAVNGRLSVAAALPAPAQLRVEVFEDLDADPLDGLGSERRPGWCA
jgi:hypothetical protein